MVAHEGLVEPGTLVASDGGRLGSAALCAHVGCTYLGTPAGTSGAERTEDLIRAGVERYLVCTPGTELPAALVPLPVPDGLGELRLYVVPAGPTPVPRGRRPGGERGPAAGDELPIDAIAALANWFSGRSFLGRSG